MSWTAYLIRPITGEVGAELSIADDGKWQIDLNDIESFTVSATKGRLQEIDRGWWKQWGGGVLITKTGLDGDEQPWLAGPIIDPPEEDRTEITLVCNGIGALFEQRMVLDKDYGADGQTPSADTMTALAQSQVRRTSMSLGTIAQDIVALSTERKMGGQLPIRYVSPRETGSKLNERTYEGFNLANNMTWKRLSELMDVINGPDIMFRPEWRDAERTHIVWAMYHGTAKQPAIEQQWEMSLDTTSPRGPVSTVKVTHDGADVTNRVYWTGAGEDQGTLIRMVQDTSRMIDYMPLLESIGSDSDSANPDLLLSHAKARLAQGGKPVTQLTLTVDGDDERTEIGHWHVGDLAAVTLGDEWLTLPRGTARQRLIAASGNFVTSEVKMEFQEDATLYQEEDPDGA